LGAKIPNSCLIFLLPLLYSPHDSHLLVLGYSLSYQPLDDSAHGLLFWLCLSLRQVIYDWLSPSLFEELKVVVVACM
jgi:hypothetical protein